MQTTFHTQAIVLARVDWREHDSRLIVYSPQGQLDLIARGTKKPTSKLAGHIEPFNLIDLMVARGRQFDYLAAGLAQTVFAQIKSDVSKQKLAGRAVNFFRALIL